MRKNNVEEFTDQQNKEVKQIITDTKHWKIPKLWIMRQKNDLVKTY